ncbi:insulin gene enhancer protein isl-1-like isoform X2 [Gigantopelta aegis]|uniref:insulin gene enhancer protein isl-1-like isoform X2 n=1 Tax=Gigantopelta aegis TaxID=1735272 RepID=UPI001B88782B|nr:insulin gene enhancer protein isl-1-like isoform X2 [Gigantopelta aegis]
MAAEPQPAKKRRVSVCVGCGSQIQDQFILRVAPDLEWHAGCLKCADCNQYLDESCTCFVRDGKTYCKRDYVRLFGTKCTKCGQGFCKNDFVMRAKNKIYHIDCFRCVACSRQLIPGDEFALRDDGLFCKADHDVVEPAGGAGSEPSSPASSNNNNNNNNTSNNNKNSGGGDQKNGGGLQLAGRAEQAGTKTRPSLHKSDHKTTRVRTVLNEKQLHTLRTCYNANPRPDALMKEQLVEMTNLSPRVIRVWFQNKRCKDKKRSILMKQIQQQQDKNGNGLQRPLQGVPMVASSPVRHEGPGIQANAVEVHSYHTPWKALSEFAMNGELDNTHPPFQQLMTTFEHMDPNCAANHSPGSDPLMHVSYLNHDDMPSSVSSDFPRTPSELSSPLSQ